MSLENFEDLTDIELRHKLLEYDFPNVPITETSRGFLVKKLKNHIKNLKSRKVSKRTYMTLRAKQELDNLVTQAHDWSQHTLQGSSLVSEEELTNAEHEMYDLADTDAQPADQIPFPLPNPLRAHTERYSTQSTDPQSNLADSNSCGCSSMFWKVLGLQENYTNGVWWAFTIFFLAIICMYMAKIADFSKYVNEGNTNYVICDKINPASPFLRPPFVCIEKERVEPALTVVRLLLMQLRKPSEQRYCYDPKQTNAISVSEFMRQEFKGGSSMDIRNVRAAQYLITCNPQWKIDMVDDNGSAVIFNGVDNALPNRNIFFVLKQPQLSLPCQLYNKAHRFINLLGNLTLLISAIILFFLAYCYVRRIQVQHRQTVQRYVEMIIEELQNRAMNSESLEGREVDVDYLCGQLIPSVKRKCELRFFNEALKELESSDSRARFGLTIRNGQECRTVCWIDYTDELVGGRFAGNRDRLIETETSC